MNLIIALTLMIIAATQIYHAWKLGKIEEEVGLSCEEARTNFDMMKLFARDITQIKEKLDGIDKVKAPTITKLTLSPEHKEKLKKAAKERWAKKRVSKLHSLTQAEASVHKQP